MTSKDACNGLLRRYWPKAPTCVAPPKLSVAGSIVVCMFDIDFSRLDPDATLAFVGRSRAAADRLETGILAAAAHWADLHGVLDADPDDPDSHALPGMEQLVQLGGAGTPVVAEFAPAELGAELAMSPFAARQLIADALDLRHRLPALWARVLAGEVKPWIARKTADATRNVAAEVAAVVDRRVAKWAHSLSWGRLENMITAAVIAADPAAAEQKTRQAETQQGVWVSQSNDYGIKDIFIRTQAPNAIWFDAALDRVADSLGLLGDTDPKDIRRAKAVGVLAQPQQALDLFTTTQPTTAGGAEPVPGACGGDARPPATLYIHVSEDSFSRDEHGVARFEGIGPVTTDQAKKWLGHCQVTVKPVIDLAGQAPVDGYEVPDRLREAMHLRSPVDVFPYASNPTRTKQADHTDPYLDPGQGGPPGQTRLDNLAPMVTFHHRIKTHGRWRVKQVFNGVFVWQSPHGRCYLVDSTGTHRADTTAA